MQQPPQMIVHLPGEATILNNDLTGLQVIPDNRPPVSMRYLTGQVCYVCQLETPQLTGQKIKAVTKCGHVFCYECALRKFFTAKKTNPDGIDCPICGQRSEMVCLTRTQFSNCEQVTDFARNLWTVLEKDNNIEERPMNHRPLMALFGDTFFHVDNQTDFLPHLESLMNIVCGRCGLNVFRVWGPIERNWRHFYHLSKHL